MSRFSIKVKLSVMYTLIAVATYVLSNLYVIRVINDNAEERTVAAMDKVIAEIIKAAEPYEIKEEDSNSGGKIYLKPGVYSEEEKHSKPVKYIDIPNSVFDDVFKPVLLKNEQHFVQIFDYEGKPLAKTDNLGEKNLPTLPTKQILYKHSPEDLVRLYNDSCTGEIFYSVDVLGTEDECFLKRKCKLNGKDVFYYFKRTKSMLITIAAPEIYFSRPVDDYYSEMLGFLPVVFIVILISGILFIRYALRPINRITAAANKITINNMHERLPELKAKDELSRLTETLNAMLDRLEVSFNEVKRFTSDASHELKTPLTILRGELELALNADEEKQDFIMTIASSLDEVIRLTNVVESLLELSRADLGRVKLNLAKKSLSRLIADIAEDAAILAEEKDLSVYAKIEPDVNFIFDPVRIHQAVINITDNAIKYNKKNGSINIGMWTVDDNVYIRISDTGYGMQEDKLEHIFDRFYRVEESRTEQGAGLGLSIVKWIVDAHEGKITVHSKFNEGTEFEIRLPMNNERLNIMYLEDRAAQERADKERADFAERQKEAKRAEKKDNEEEA